VVSDLLPIAPEAPLCSDFSRELGVKPAGTGLSLDRVIVVETPLPWPKPALKHPRLQPGAQALAGSPVRSRLFAAEPWTEGADVHVELFERRPTGFVRHRWTVADEHELTELVGWIASTPLGQLDASADEVPPTLLVCTQGSHDECCGLHGERLAAELEEKLGDVELRRVSHTGGHRFAPTLLALPGGRMWAYADVALAARVARGAETEADLRHHCRGWLGVPVGMAQVAELAARIHRGTDWPRDPVLERGPECDGGGERWMVGLGEAATVVEVRPGRVVPTIACESPGGLPAKQATEYEWQVVEPAWS